MKWLWRDNKTITLFVGDRGTQVQVYYLPSIYSPQAQVPYPSIPTVSQYSFLRGASAINWTIIDGDEEGGFSIFWADDGLDTGPILLQRKCKVSMEYGGMKLIDWFLSRSRRTILSTHCTRDFSILKESLEWYGRLQYLSQYRLISGRGRSSHRWRKGARYRSGTVIYFIVSWDYRL